MNQEVPIWDPKNLPTSWDEAKDMYGLIECGVRVLPQIKFVNLNEKDRDYIYRINGIDNNQMITYYNFGDQWYCEYPWNTTNMIYTFIDNELVEYSHYNNWYQLGHFATLLAKHGGQEPDEFIDKLQSVAQLPKSARK